jgi:hypothetical protein
VADLVAVADLVVLVVGVRVAAVQAAVGSQRGCNGS